MSNEEIYGGPLKATVQKAPHTQNVTVRGDGNSFIAATGNLEKSISMALNQFYRPEVTVEDRFQTVDEELLKRHTELVEKREELNSFIEDVESSALVANTACWEAKIVRDAIDEYVEDLETAMDVINSEINARRNQEDSET